MQEKRKYRKFTKEFKLEAVKMVVEQGHKQTETARNLGINCNMLGRWVAEFKADQGEAFPGNGKLKPQEDEIRMLQKALKRVTMERDILKKAVAYFAEIPE